MLAILINLRKGLDGKELLRSGEVISEYCFLPSQGHNKLMNEVELGRGY